MDIEDVEKIVSLTELNTTEVALMGMVGILLMVAGYKIKKIAFFIVWFILGFSLAGYLTPLFVKFAPDLANSDLWQGILPIVGGLLMGLMGFTVEKICVSGIAFGLTLAITAQYFGTGMQAMLLGGVVGVIAAGAAAMLMKPATIVATSIAGAYALTLAITQDLNATVGYMPILLVGAAVGSIIQFLTTKHDS